MVDGKIFKLLNLNSGTKLFDLAYQVIGIQHVMNFFFYWFIFSRHDHFALINLIHHINTTVYPVYNSYLNS